MATFFLDSFDHYTTAHITKKWFSAGGSVTISTTTPRTGPQCLQIGTFGHAAGLTVPANLGKPGCGFAIYQTVATGADQTFAAINAVNATRTHQLQVTSGGFIKVLKGGVLKLTTAASAIPLNTWTYIEFSCILDDTDVFKLRVNGVELGSVGTTTTADTSWSSFSLNGCAANTRFDDVYLFDTLAGASMFHNPVKIYARLPQTGGPSTQWDPFPAVANHLNVNDDPALDVAPVPDDDGTIVRGDGTDLDLYNMFDFPIDVPTIAALQSCIYAKADAGNALTLTAVHGAGATNFSTPVSMASQTTYTFIRQFPASLSTNVATVNAELFGIKAGS